LQQSVGRAGKIEAFFGDGDQQADRDGDSELRFDHVFTGSVECRDAQVLLDPLEEQFNLPSALVECADGCRGQGELVGEEDKVLAGIRVAEADAAQVAGIILAAQVAVERNGLIGKDAGLLVRRAGVDAGCVEVTLGASDKESSGQMDAVQPSLLFPRKAPAQARSAQLEGEAGDGFVQIGELEFS